MITRLDWNSALSKRGACSRRFSHGFVSASQSELSDGTRLRGGAVWAAQNQRGANKSNLPADAGREHNVDSESKETSENCRSRSCWVRWLISLCGAHQPRSPCYGNLSQSGKARYAQIVLLS